MHAVYLSRVAAARNYQKYWSRIPRRISRLYLCRRWRRRAVSLGTGHAANIPLGDLDLAELGETGPAEDVAALGQLDAA